MQYFRVYNFYLFIFITRLVYFYLSTCTNRRHTLFLSHWSKLHWITVHSASFKVISCNNLSTILFKHILYIVTIQFHTHWSYSSRSSCVICWLCWVRSESLPLSEWDGGTWTFCLSLRSLTSTRSSSSSSELRLYRKSACVLWDGLASLPVTTTEVFIIYVIKYYISRIQNWRV